LYIQQKFGGFCHLYIGQEAILSGMMHAIRPTDRVITAYRDHAHPLVMGSDPKKVMAELYGKSTGLSKGKGGSMHMFDKERNLFGGHGIVGAQIPMGAGIAFADKYRGEDHVTLTFFGDGAARQGALFETFNMAMTWKWTACVRKPSAKPLHALQHAPAPVKDQRSSTSRPTATRATP
jgi:pyruvate dehydrogenase E1 component alpha subunit